jgi:pimeloyl-ACP methyl ester carboxylesterase
LVLSPGFNGNGRSWIENRDWQLFAEQHNLALVGLSFASEGDLLRKGQGYYYPSQGAGQVFLDGVDNALGESLPLLLYGFSGGAHFTSGFAAWKPERVMGWCAYSAEWWEKPVANNASPPGLVICGDEDERYGASLLYFKQGRALGKPWLWLSIHQNGHSIASSSENFVRTYFASLLEAKGVRDKGQWVDIDLKTKADPALITAQPTLTGWLPQTSLLGDWQAIHQP